MSETMATRTPEEIEQATEKLLRDLKAVVQDGEELLRAGAHHISERGAAARERLSAALGSAKETRQRLEERALCSAKKADLMVQEHPYESVGIAFGLGIVLGLMLHRR